MLPRRTANLLATLSLTGTAILLPPSATAARAPAACHGHTATIVGTSGDDTLTGTDGPDVIAGLDGSDKIHGLGGDEVVCGGSGHHVIYRGDGPVSGARRR